MEDFLRLVSKSGSPILTGALLALRWNPQQIFLVGAVPAFCAALAVAFSYLLSANGSAYRPPRAAAQSTP